MSRRTLWALLLGGVGLLLGIGAYLVWLVSDAHGHGLASGDRRAILLMSLGCAGCLGLAAFMLVRPE